MGYKTEFSIKNNAEKFRFLNNWNMWSIKKVKQDHHVALATDRNVHTVFLIPKT